MLNHDDVIQSGTMVFRVSDPDCKIEVVSSMQGTFAFVQCIDTLGGEGREIKHYFGRFNIDRAQDSIHHIMQTGGKFGAVLTRDWTIPEPEEW
ncbi:hypothetical protein [Thioalkalivibrio sp. ALE28]|uniref:hypothetical protein n=1 Tax=Thioalkalivibrio sp. ALE28 TaxID=1158179 RepID=UPI0012DCF2C7|nr:hypothetical protein [Thioalkalivibrio sp. ALE28]